MKVENINGALREVFQEMIDGGAKKRHVCGLTLGAQNEPQFESFLKGADFGLKPLQRLIQNMGYSFNIVIVPQEASGELTKIIEKANQDFITSSKKLLIERLGDEGAVKASTIAKTGIIVDISNELFNEIVK